MYDVKYGKFPLREDADPSRQQDLPNRADPVDVAGHIFPLHAACFISNSPCRIWRISSTISGLARVVISPTSVPLDSAANTRRMILPERVLGMSGTITTVRGRAIGPISLATAAAIRCCRSVLGR